eukprot:TRINITY_DN81002_c0_g1_i1.p2 TRINITY_DN81002_c0_g1~~TRINITY_DN81002_c0_g1_i1.p2  ORF type:complete len:177 (-),score=41.07 TRINITY_DN81002_c0_g1_i1:183-713(-)
MARRAAIALALLNAVRAEEEVGFVTGGTLKLTWSDCGDASTKGKVTGFTPDSLTLGQKATLTGAGSLTESVTGGDYALSLKAGIISQTFTGDMCQPKTFDLPLGTGSLSWDGVKCPLPSGATSISVDVTLSAALPGALASADIKVAATSSNGDKLLCLDVKTAPSLDFVSNATVMV